jgi:uncharacterized membrane protein YidH (DUF202 family)
MTVRPDRGDPGGDPGDPGDDPEERDPGLARERTSLAWTRTAIAFGALGGAILKANVITGLLVLAMAPVIWQIGHVSRGAYGPRGNTQRPDMPQVGAVRLFLITVAIMAVAAACLVIAVFGKSVPGALR